MDQCNQLGQGQSKVLYSHENKRATAVGESLLKKCSEILGIAE
jgi:hypothetical protein